MHIIQNSEEILKNLNINKAWISACCELRDMPGINMIIIFL